MIEMCYLLSAHIVTVCDTLCTDKTLKNYIETRVLQEYVPIEYIQCDNFPDIDIYFYN